MEKSGLGTHNNRIINVRGYMMTNRANSNGKVGSFEPVLDRGTGTFARDRRAQQQLAPNVHVKHSDLT